MSLVLIVPAVARAPGSQFDDTVNGLSIFQALIASLSLRITHIDRSRRFLPSSKPLTEAGLLRCGFYSIQTEKTENSSRNSASFNRDFHRVFPGTPFICF
jgi:hypothetical protein